MSDQNTPVTVEEIEALIETLPFQRNPSDLEFHYSLPIVAKLIREHGVPDPSTYSLTSITASCIEDLYMKIFLARLPAIKKFQTSNATREEYFAEIAPIEQARYDWAMDNMFKKTDWPVTITVKETEEA
ncbi:MAG: hypothetical protein OSB62_04085 [Alphaproteobacteria bacterium]|nr:hypothetical protein [Alphaproteobacteria bacterium]